MARVKKNSQPLTTAQQLGSLIKSARDIMRKDKGLNGDLDRLPMLTWIMFLKFLDDMEQIREQEATMRGEKFRQAIEAPYRWRDWAAREDGITGDELISFVNNDEAVRPDGKKGPGLFAYLRGFRSGRHHSDQSALWLSKCLYASTRKPPVPQTGSRTVSPRHGLVTSTKKRTTGRGV